MRNIITPVLFAAIVLVLSPAALHSTFEGSYVVNRQGTERVFWIGPISTTIPFVLLAIVFLVHCLTRKAATHLPAYTGAVLALIAMTILTYYFISHPRGPDRASTMAIAVFFTPPLYVPIMVISYAIGSFIGVAYSYRRELRPDPQRSAE